MKNKKPKEKPEWIDWVIRGAGLSLIICWAFFYRTPITLAEGNFLYRIGHLAEYVAILLVLYKIASFNCKDKTNKNEKQKQKQKA